MAFQDRPSLLCICYTLHRREHGSDFADLSASTCGDCSQVYMLMKAPSLTPSPDPRCAEVEQPSPPFLLLPTAVGLQKSAVSVCTPAQ